MSRNTKLSTKKSSILSQTSKETHHSRNDTIRSTHDKAFFPRPVVRIIKFIHLGLPERKLENCRSFHQFIVDEQHMNPFDVLFPCLYLIISDCIDPVRNFCFATSARSVTLIYFRHSESITTCPSSVGVMVPLVNKR